MSRAAPSSTALRVADLPQNRETAFDLRPSDAELEALRDSLDLLGLRKVRFEGKISAEGEADWLLTGHLGATVIQPCAVTTAPVTTRIETPVRRLYAADYTEVDAPEVEMPEDDEVEPLPAWIDPAVVMAEALDLALPLFPRADGAELGEAVFTEPGKTPMRDEDARPFAGLATLKDQMKDDGE